MDAKRPGKDGGAPRPPTLRDIARVVGVSPSTVSAVLNDAPRAHAYSAATVQRIRDAAQDMGYVPNVLARTLKRSRSGMVGLLVLAGERLFGVPNLQGVSARARERGFEVVAADSAHDTESVQRALNSLLSWRVEGVVLLTGAVPLREEAVRPLTDGRVPFVRVGVRQPGLPLPGVVTDNYAAGRLLGSHLAGLGHRFAVILGGEADNECSTEWASGISKAFEGVPGADLRRVPRDSGARAGLACGYRLASRVLEVFPGATALVCESDTMAMGAVRRLREHGLTVPGDVSVAGGGDICPPVAHEENRLTAFFHPSLTTLRGPREEMGALAFDMLLGWMGDPGGERAAMVVEYPPQLIVRESTGPPPSAVET